MPALCRDCLTVLQTLPTSGRCPHCARPRLIAHDELLDLSLAHLDCDAFFAAVEKRDRPELTDKPVIIGGGRRGVVATACYVARRKGVGSAMPMFKALQACPEAVVLKPDIDKYRRVSQDIRALMDEITPSVEPLSLDEAFLDLSGTERLHGAPPAVVIARLQNRIEKEIGITASVGLAANKFLAKVASDHDKPRGLSVIGAREAAAFLAPRPISLIWGVGPKFAAALAQAGLRRIGDIQALGEREMIRRHGPSGARLFALAMGRDARSVETSGRAKSISAETTFESDISDIESLAERLWPLCERVARRARAKSRAGRVVTLKIKRADFRALTRQTRAPVPVETADTLYRTGRELLSRLEPTGPVRLIGIGISGFEACTDSAADLFETGESARARAREEAMEHLRARFGDKALMTGRSARLKPRDQHSGSGRSSSD